MDQEDVQQMEEESPMPESDQMRDMPDGDENQ